MSESKDTEKDTANITRWANWALMGNDAIFPHQVPFAFRELHSRIEMAIKQAVKEELARIKKAKRKPK